MLLDLKSVNVRTVYEEKVVKIELEVPYGEIKDKTFDDIDFIKYLRQRVGKKVALDFKAVKSEFKDEIEK